MKSIILLITILSIYAQKPAIETHKFLINIWDYDFSSSYTRHYKINNDSIIVTGTRSIQNEAAEKVLLSRVISQCEKKELYDFLSSFPLDSLSAEYKNPSVKDGDQKRIEIVFNDKNKTIDIANVYQKDIGDLFNIINRFLTSDVKIQYER